MKWVVKIKAIILAAGYATRLYPLTEHQPKALLIVGSTTILSHIMIKLEEVDEVDEVIIVTNDRFEGNFMQWKKSVQTKKKITVLNDGTKTNEDRMGAVRDMNFALDGMHGNDDVMVIASDNLFGFSLKDFVAYYTQKNASVVALYDMKEKQKVAKKYGVAVLAPDGRVIEFEEKPEHPKTSIIGTACYIFTRSAIKKLGNYLAEGHRKDNPGDFLKWTAQNEPVYGWVFKEHWFDIGSFEALEEARMRYEKVEVPQ